MTRQPKIRNQTSSKGLNKALWLGNLGWKQWEQLLEKAYIANGWTVWVDRDRPTSNKRILASRQPDHPDLFGFKYFEGNPPAALGRAARYMRSKTTYQLWLEAKTGSGQKTDGQAYWIETLDKTPGVVARVVYPYDFDKVVEMLGGVYPDYGTK